MIESVLLPCNRCGNIIAGSPLPGTCSACLLGAALKFQVDDAGSSEADILPRLGDYVLEEEIARGGMGVVYRAWQNSLDRPVAVKMLLAGQLATTESIDRFRIEAAAAARLDHPAIVPIYEVGEYETQYFFSMKLVEGADLGSRHDEFVLPDDPSPRVSRMRQIKIATLLLEVGRALQFAHEHGVLHRDLKPTNILIDQLGRPHLTDFGLAKLTDDQASGLTLTSAVLGSPSYMSPEQATGRVNDVSAAVDIYGLGAVLYELLTGQAPFVGETAIETIRLVIDTPVVPPRRNCPWIDRDLETIAMKCLEKNPRQRYASMSQLVDDLERFVNHQPISARPVSRLEHIYRWCRRNPVTTGLLAMVAFSCIAGFTGMVWQWRQTRTANQTLAQTIDHLHWTDADQEVRDGNASGAIARVAAMLREQPGNSKLAMYGMSVLDTHRFPVPVAAPVHHPKNAELSVARLSPNGDRLVTASIDGTARLWDPLTSVEVTPPLQHDGPVTWAEFSPDGRRVATSSKDGTVRLWDTANGQIVFEPIRHSRPVKFVWFLDSQRILAHTGNSIHVLSADSGAEVLPPMVNGKPISVAKLSRDRQVLLTAGGGAVNGEVALWDMTTGTRTGVVQCGQVRDADLHPDRSRVVVAGAPNKAAVWDIQSDEPLFTIEDDVAHFTHVRYSPDGNRVAIASLDQTVHLWDAQTGSPIGQAMNHYFLVGGIRFDDSGDRLLTWSSDATAQLWNGRSGKPLAGAMHHADFVHYAEYGQLADDTDAVLTTVSHSLAFASPTGAAQLWRVSALDEPRSRSVDVDLKGLDSAIQSPSGRWIATGMTNGQVWVVQTDTGEVVAGPLAIDGGAWGLFFVPDESRLIAATSRGNIYIWSMPEGERLFDPIELDTTIQPATISSRGDRFATGSTDHWVRIWDSKDGRLVSRHQHDSELNSLDFSADGTMIVSASADHTAIIADVETGEQLQRLIGHTNEVMTAKFSPDDKHVVTTSRDFTARLWDPSTGRQVLPAMRHRGEVIHADFSPDSRFVVTGGRDQTAVIWDVQTGRPTSRPLAHGQAVANVDYSPDGQRILTADFRGLRLWDSLTGNPLTAHLEHRTLGGTGFHSDSSVSALSPDGSSILAGADARQAKVWKIPIAPPDAPAWLPDFFESVAGIRLSAETDAPEIVPPESFLKIRKSLLDSKSTDAYTRWAQTWLTRQESDVSRISKE